MKIRGQLVDILVSIDPDKYSPCVYETGKSKILYVRMKKPLYSMLKALILYYKHFRGNIEAIEYVVNLCNIHAMNKNINNKQHTLTQYADNPYNSTVAIP